MAMHNGLAGTEKTVQFSREELNEGWAELGRTPRVLAKIKFGAKTDLGRIRENNEDKFDFYDANQSSDTHASLRRAVEEANSLIYDTAQMITERNGMGTTLTAVIVREDMLTVVQVGDSRAYLVRDEEITQITEDHSWVSEQVRNGSMTLEEAQASPFRNIITRSIGTSSSVEADITTHPLQEDDIIIMCSDGLSGHLDISEIRNAVLEHSPSIAATRLIEEANERGGRDNITVLVISVRELKSYESDAEDEAGAAQLAYSASDQPKSEKRVWGRRK